MILSYRPGVSGPDSSKRRESRSNRIRRILREETHQLRSYHELTDRYPTGRWVELVVSEPGEECIDEKKLKCQTLIQTVVEHDFVRNISNVFYPQLKSQRCIPHMEGSRQHL